MRKKIIKKVFVILAAIVVIFTTAWAVVMYIVPTQNLVADPTETAQTGTVKVENTSGVAKELNLKTSLNIVWEDGNTNKSQ